MRSLCAPGINSLGHGILCFLCIAGFNVLLFCDGFLYLCSRKILAYNFLLLFHYHQSSISGLCWTPKLCWEELPLSSLKQCGKIHLVSATNVW